MKRVCDDCLRKGHIRCPIDGWDHCEHHHRPGGGQRTQGVDTKQDVDKAVMLSSKPKAMVSTAVLETLDEDDDECSEDAVILSVNVGEHNETTDSIYTDLDCFPESTMHSRPATALLTGDPTVLSDLQSIFQALLDSACTYHIIRDKSLFWTYRPDQAIEVGTSSSGYLMTEAKGLVKLEVEVVSANTPSPRVILSLHDCLHGPSAPMNLLSVGVFIESGMPLTFDTDGFAQVHFPDSHPVLAGSYFRAVLRERLAFLKCKFIPPPSPIPSGPAEPSPALTYISFTPRAPDYELWHEHLAHPGDTPSF